MGFFFFNNITSKNHKIRTNTLEPRNFWKTRSINAIKFNSFQRKPVNALNWWDDKIVCRSYFINKPLPHVIDYENNNKYSRNRRKCRSNLNHQLHFENFSYDPLNVFPKPLITKLDRTIS